MLQAQGIDLTIQAVLASANTSFWLHRALTGALDRDCVDAARDAELLAALLEARCISVVGGDHAAT